MVRNETCVGKQQIATRGVNAPDGVDVQKKFEKDDASLSDDGARDLD